LIEFLYRHICKHKTSYFSQYYSHQSLEIRNMVYWFETENMSVDKFMNRGNIMYDITCRTISVNLNKLTSVKEKRKQSLWTRNIWRNYGAIDDVINISVKLFQIVNVPILLRHDVYIQCHTCIIKKMMLNHTS
jgi:hypothetical protein